MHGWAGPLSQTLQLNDESWMLLIINTKSDPMITGGKQTLQ